MGNFEDFVGRKRQKEADAEPKFDFEIEEELNQAFIQGESLYDEQKNKGVGNEDTEIVSVDYVNNLMRNRMEQSTFEERAEYYFKDHEYLNAKVERYTSLASEENKDLDIYAEKYTNRNARKRKSRAKDAAKNFRKAKDLEILLRKKENRNGGEPLPAIELYMARNDIMRARMEGMINAAKVKATSSQNEAYRIAKAKLSCLSILYDQARNLQDKAYRDDFVKIQEGLLKEIADAQKALKKNKPKLDEEWNEALGVNDQAYIDKIKKESQNPYVKDEDVKLSLQLQCLSKEATKPEFREVYVRAEKVFGKRIDPRLDIVIFGLDYVKRDRNGKPINKEEVLKDQRNHKWLGTLLDKGKGDERRQMITEAFKRLKDTELPTPAELKKNGPAYYLKKDPYKYFSLMTMSLHIDNAKELEPYAKEYYESDNVLKAKLDAATFFSAMATMDLKANYNIDWTHHNEIYNGDRYSAEGSEEDKKNAIKEEKAEVFDFITEYEKAYSEYGKVVQAEKPMTKEQVFAAAHRKDFDEGSYRIYTDMKKAVRMLDCPEYCALYKPVHDVLGDKNDISRVCGSMLRIVHFDENWNPVSKDDMAAHEWNIQYLNRLRDYHLKTENKDIAQAKLMEMLDEEILKYFQGQYKVLTPEELRKQILEPLKAREEAERKAREQAGEQVKKQAEKPPYCEEFEKQIENIDVLQNRFLKVLTLEGTYKTMPFMKDFIQAHPEIEACQDMYKNYHTLLIMYGNSAHHVTLDPSANLGTMSGTGLGLNDSAVVQGMIDMYEESYNNFHNLIKG